LPDDIVWDIIRRSCYDNEKLPQSAGKILRDETEFWPSWDAKGTNNANRVEPDLYISFEELDLIIEAKREYNQQKEGQWRNECKAYCNMFNSDQRNVVVIAIDGISSTKPDEVRNKNRTFRVFKTKWRKLYDTIEAELCKQEKKNGLQQTILILQQIKLYCDYLGIATVWPKEAFEKISEVLEFDKFDTCIKTLCDINSSFETKNDEEEIPHIGFNAILNNEYDIMDFPATIRTLTKMEFNYG
jgi:hypothetical protein